MSPQGFKCPLKYSLLSHGTAGHCPVLLKLIRSRVFLDGDIMNIPDKTRTLKSDELKSVAPVTFGIPGFADGSLEAESEVACAGHPSLAVPGEAALLRAGPI